MTEKKVSKACVYAFTQAGARLADRICAVLEAEGWHAQGLAPHHCGQGLVHTKERRQSLKDSVRIAFTESDCLVFVGAAGIAVRAIAPFLSSKQTDPAVICTDEKGKNVISLLSGHVGGANRLTRLIASGIGGNAVITTASDVNGVAAVDEWAESNNLAIADFDTARQMASFILSGGKVGIYSDYTLPKKLPDIFSVEAKEWGVCISLDEKKKPFPFTLNLIPRIAAAGAGCRRGADGMTIYTAVTQMMSEAGISPLSLKGLYSIDLKKEEEGMHQAAEMLKVPFVTYDAAELEGAPGAFSESEFVREVTGTGTVCERAAVLGSDGGTLTIAKTIRDSVAVALAISSYKAESDKSKQ